MTDVREFDAAYHLDNPEVIAAYLGEAFETGDKAFIAYAVKTVARARGIGKVAARLGMSRSGLYKALGPAGNPSFSTMLQFLSSLGMDVSIRPHSEVARPRSAAGRKASVRSGRAGPAPNQRKSARKK